MVISALTIYFLASLPGEAQKFKMKAEAMPTALLSCCERRGRGLSFPRQGSRKRSQRALAPQSLCSALWKHLWKYNECKCRHPGCPGCRTVLWQAVTAAEQSRLPMLWSPKICNWSLKFSLLENSRNEYLSLSLLPLIFYSHNKPTCELP